MMRIVWRRGFGFGFLKLSTSSELSFGLVSVLPLVIDYHFPFLQLLLHFLLSVSLIFPFLSPFFSFIWHHRKEREYFEAIYVDSNGGFWCRGNLGIPQEKWVFRGQIGLQSQYGFLWLLEILASHGTLPPLVRIQSTSRRSKALAGAGDCSKSSSISLKDEFVRLGSSTSDIFS